MKYNQPSNEKETIGLSPGTLNRPKTVIQRQVQVLCCNEVLCSDKELLLSGTSFI